MNLDPEAIAKKAVQHIVNDLIAMETLGNIKFIISPKELYEQGKNWIDVVKDMIHKAEYGGIYRGFFDGSSKPNPGEMKIGGYIESPTGDAIDSFSQDIGNGTNNVAEYSAFIELCKRVKQAGIQNIRIEGDSALVINQVNGKWQAKNADMKRLKAQALALLDGVNYGLYHIPRSENAKADQLTR